MTGPEGSDPNQQWAPGEQSHPPTEEATSQASWQPEQQSQPPTEEPTSQASWQQHQPYAEHYPSEPQPFPENPQYQQYPSGEQVASQPTQYGPMGEQAAAEPSQFGTSGQYSPLGQSYPPSEPYGQQPTQFGQATGQFGEPAPYTPPGADKESKRSLIILSAVIGVLAVIIVAVVLVMGFWKPGFFWTTKLDMTKAQQGVQQVLTDKSTGYGLEDVHDVKCNDGQNKAVKKGDTFSCTVTVGSNHRTLTATFTDDTGTYEVGKPQ
jgi:hypothetical protein